MPAAIEKSIQKGVQWMQGTVNAQQYYAQYQQGVAELQQALDDNEPLETLEQLYFALQNAAAQANQVVPQDLEQFYRNRTDYQKEFAEYQHRVNKVIAFIGIGVVVLAILIVASLFIRAQFTRTQGCSGQNHPGFSIVQKSDREELKAAATLFHPFTSSCDSGC